MKIIILGAGRVGASVAEALVSEENDITVVDTDVLNLRERRANTPLVLWSNSEYERKLALMEDMLSRFPDPASAEAFRLAEQLDTPLLTYSGIA